MPPPPPPLAPVEQARPPAASLQCITKVRRDYNGWVASDTMEDYALRFTPQRFRKWSEWRVCRSALSPPSTASTWTC